MEIVSRCESSDKRSCPCAVQLLLSILTWQDCVSELSVIDESPEHAESVSEHSSQYTSER